ncbi:MAG: ornithine cyclodeaminase family protein [Chloroflexi bacterium]|nr:ornithine cyclodeaminase family protein [Chloroflexota bacterium]
MARFLTEDHVRQLLPMDEALAQVEACFHALGTGQARNQPRRRIRLPDGMMHVMSAGDVGLGVFGHKVYTTTRRGARFLVTLYSTDDGRPLAVLEASLLGAIRTGAASGIATKYLASSDASVLGVLGTGRQAPTQIQAVCAVRPIERVLVYSRNAEKREAFAQEMAASLGIAVEAADSAQEAVASADVVAAITDSKRPVLAGAWLKPGAHVNAAGNNMLAEQELDVEVFRRAWLITTDSLEGAKLECGDLLAAVEPGSVQWEDVVEIGQVVAGRHPVDRPADAITVYESQGIAAEDLYAAVHVLRKAEAEGIGTELPF